MTARPWVILLILVSLTGVLGSSLLTAPSARDTAGRLEASAATVLAGPASAGGMAALPEPRAAAGRRSEAYSYHSARFTGLVADSYRDAPGKPEDFYAWFAREYAAGKAKMPWHSGLSLDAALKARAQDLAGIRDATSRRAAEISTCQWVHRMVKTVIPRFSLDRGFEFHCTVSRGERQCFLQSVLIAGLLQSMGIDAGTVMVYRNPEGQPSNIGHAVTLVKLSGGKADIIVDASEREPFAMHQGLMVRADTYAFVRPRYGAQADSMISSYQTEDGRSTLSVRQVRSLDYAFIRSQFDYYRGERVPGGILASSPAKEGLESSARSLRESVRVCPGNPLATYMLGRVYLEQGKPSQARALLATAVRLYSRYGWVPDGPREYLGRIISQR